MDAGGSDAGASDSGSSTPDGGAPDGGAPDAGPPAVPFVYVGSSAGSIYLYAVDLASGALTSRGSVATGTTPSFLAVDPSATHLYAVGESTNEVLAYAIDAGTGDLTLLNRVSSGGSGPAFLSVDPSGRFVLAANYGGASVSALPIQPSGALGAATSTVSTGLNPHMAIADPGNAFVLVPCLGSDQVAQFLWNPATGALSPNAVPTVATAAGAGPRHLAFGRGAPFAYLINETNSTMVAYGFSSTTGRLRATQTLSTLPAGFTGSNTGAEVQVHPSGRFLYGSNRGDDSIVAYALDAVSGQMTLIGHAKTGGQSPRHFSLDPAGRWLFAANVLTNDITALEVDADAGTLTPLGSVAQVPSPEYVGVVLLR